jgi:hypothetical protein
MTTDIHTEEKPWLPIAEEMWAFLKDLSKSQAETKKMIDETSVQMKETDARMKETAMRMKETDKQIGRLANRFGDVIEYMFVPNLAEQFKKFGYTLTKTQRDIVIADYANDIHTEIDALLENGDYVIVVEIKTKLILAHIDEHIERIEKVKKNAELHGDKRKFLGAIGAAVVSPAERNYTLKQGFFLIEQSGENINITKPVSMPREW